MKKLLLTTLFVIFTLGSMFSQENLNRLDFDTKKYQSFQQYKIHNLNYAEINIDAIHRKGFSNLNHYQIDEIKLDPFKMAFNSSVREDVYLLDSTYDYSWNPGKGFWEQTLRNLFTYDLFGNETIELGQEWDIDLAKWINFSRDLSTYDDENNLTERIYQRWVKGTDLWLNMARYMNTYQNANMKERIRQEWDPGQEIWVNDYKDELSYDSEGYLIDWLNMVWAADLQVWINSTLTTYTYDQSMLRIEMLDEEWNEATQTWENSIKTSYTYENENLIESLLEVWNSSQSVWINSLKTISVYDDTNKLTEKTLQFWQNSSWTNMTKRIYIYDDNDYIYDFIVQNWDDGSGTWINNYRFIFTYDENGNWLEDLGYFWDIYANDWVEWLKFNYYWSIHDIVGQNDVQQLYHSVYPNPFSTYVNIGYFLEQAGFVEVSIYNLSGQLTETLISDYQRKGNHKIRWNASDYFPGFYLYKIQTTRGTQTGKLFLTD